MLPGPERADSTRPARAVTPTVDTNRVITRPPRTARRACRAPPLVVQGDVPVDVHRHLQRGVAGDLHHRPRRHSQAQEHRHAPVTKVVHPHDPHACLRHRRLDQLRAVVGVDRCADRGREHEAGRRPLLGQVQPLLASWRSRWSTSAPRTTAGSGIVRWDRTVLVGRTCSRPSIRWSPCLTSIEPASRSTASHVSPIASLRRSPRSDNMTYSACSRSSSVPFRNCFTSANDSGSRRRFGAAGGQRQASRRSSPAVPHEPRPPEPREASNARTGSSGRRRRGHSAAVTRPLPFVSRRTQDRRTSGHAAVPTL